jgi:hypothetical protein
MNKEDITWRTSWDTGGDGHRKGPITSGFNASVWPTLYVLDRRGVIRHQFLGFPGTKKLDAAIDALVSAAENDGGVSRSRRP